MFTVLFRWSLDVPIMEADGFAPLKACLSGQRGRI